MEIKNILDALIMDGVEEITQLCTCSYNGKTVDFRLLNDDIGIIDEIEFPTEDGNWEYEYQGETDETIDLILDAIQNAPYEVFHKSDVGAELKLNCEKIKPQFVPNHMKTDFYVDEEGPIVFILEKNIVKLEN